MDFALKLRTHLNIKHFPLFLPLEAPKHRAVDLILLFSELLFCREQQEETKGEMNKNVTLIKRVKK